MIFIYEDQIPGGSKKKRLSFILLILNILKIINSKFICLIFKFLNYCLICEKKFLKVISAKFIFIYSLIVRYSHK